MEYSITQFTPWSGLIGGALIGLSAGLMILLNGRIAGISGMAAGLMTRNPKEAGWRLVFIIGLVLGALLYPLLSGNPIPVDLQVSLPTMFAGGLLVGFGARLGSGCTSGHGVCGLSRLSPTSLAATLTFFVTAMVTVYIVRHLGG